MKLAFLLIISLLLLGCTSEQVKTTPTPSQNAQGTPSIPSASLTSNQANEQASTQITASEQASLQIVPTVDVKSCTTPFECTGDAPNYCADGRVISLCEKCGCPGDKTCGSQFQGGGYNCVAENEKGPGFQQAPAFLLKSKEPTDGRPSPNPTPAPSQVPSECQANQTNPGLESFALKVAVAYNQTFGSDLKFTQATAQSKSFYYLSGLLETQAMLSQGGKYYVAYGETEELIPVLSGCAKKIALYQSSTADKPFKYNFRMHCFNDTLFVDARVSEKALADNKPEYLGRKFAEKLAEVCG